MAVKTLSHQEGFVGTIVRAGSLNFILGVLALLLDVILEIPPMGLSFGLALFIFIILILSYVTILVWSAFILVDAKKNGELATKGPYAIIRHPMYVGIVLLVNPAIAILLHSWSLLEACFVVYFIWRHYAHKEEKELLGSFDEGYGEYQKKTGCLFPKI